jgi:hypothetical protein
MPLAPVDRTHRGRWDRRVTLAFGRLLGHRAARRRPRFCRRRAKVRPAIPIAWDAERGRGSPRLCFGGSVGAPGPNTGSKRTCRHRGLCPGSLDGRGLKSIFAATPGRAQPLLDASPDIVSGVVAASERSPKLTTMPRLTASQADADVNPHTAVSRRRRAADFALVPRILGAQPLMVERLEIARRPLPARRSRQRPHSGDCRHSSPAGGPDSAGERPKNHPARVCQIARDTHWRPESEPMRVPDAYWPFDTSVDGTDARNLLDRLGVKSCKRGNHDGR